MNFVSPWLRWWNPQLCRIKADVRTELLLVICTLHVKFAIENKTHKIVNKKDNFIKHQKLCCVWIQSQHSKGCGIEYSQCGLENVAHLMTGFWGHGTSESWAALCIPLPIMQQRPSRVTSCEELDASGHELLNVLRLKKKMSRLQFRDIPTYVYSLSWVAWKL